MSADEQKPIDFSHLGGRKLAHPLVEKGRKEPIDFTRIGGTRVGQALEKTVEVESDSE